MMKKRASGFSCPPAPNIFHALSHASRPYIYPHWLSPFAHWHKGSILFSFQVLHSFSVCLFSGKKRRTSASEHKKSSKMKEIFSTITIIYFDCNRISKKVYCIVFIKNTMNFTQKWLLLFQTFKIIYFNLLAINSLFLKKLFYHSNIIRLTSQKIDSFITIFINYIF